MAEVFTVICNGRSLRGFDFDQLKGQPCIGMCNAYREFRRIPFSPRYYLCMDKTVSAFHATQYQKFMDEHPDVQRLFFSNTISTILSLNDPKRFSVVRHTFMEPPELTDTSFTTNMTCSGAAAAQLGMLLGYKTIALLGADCNQIERLPESIDIGENVLLMTETPNYNPNYWFDDYQMAGDRYGLPQKEEWHRTSWHMLAQEARQKGVRIVNCSDVSTLTCFEKQSFKEIK